MPYLPLSSPLWQSQPSGHLTFARLSISKLPLIEYIIVISFFFLIVFRTYTMIAVVTSDAARK